MALKNMTLLYVEDEEELGELMSDFLQDEVKTLWIAKNGEEGLAMFNEYNPDIVMSDIYMPKVDGLTMSKQMKDSYPDKPIVLLTAFTNPEDMKQAIEIGIDHYINKPIQTQEQIEKPLHQIAKTLQLQKDKTRLEELLQTQSRTAAVGEMIANVAHQWRQPLAIISASCNSLEVDLELENIISNEQLRKFINDVNIQTQYLSTTINSFKNYLKPEADLVGEINLKDLIDNALSIMSSTIENDKIECFTELNDVMLSGSKTYFDQVFVNMLNNSRDAMIVNQVKDKYIFISLREENQRAIISFKDSGGGIKDDIIDRIFEPYFTTKHKSQGTGLGLDIVFKLVSQYQGTVEAQNVEYEYNNKKLKGAEFTISIPLEHK